MASLRCYGASDCKKPPDHKKVSSLYNTAVVTFFHNSTHADVVDVQTWEVSPLKNPVEPPERIQSSLNTAFNHKALRNSLKYFIFSLYTLAN